MSSSIPKHVVDFSTLRVMCLDDQTSFQKIMKATLIELGFSRISIFSTAEEAKKACRRDQFDIYLFDYNLGYGENGRQVINYLVQNNYIPSEAIIFIISGDRTRALVLSAIELEPDDYVIKPFSTEQLRIRLNRAIMRKRELEDLYKIIHTDKYEDIIAICHNHLANQTPYSIYVRVVLSEAYLKINDFDNAYVTIQEGLAFAESTWFRLQLGKVNYYLEAYDHAIEDLQMAVHNKPFGMESYKWLCNCYIKKGDTIKAREILNQAVNISPQSSSFLHMQTNLAISTNDYAMLKDALGSLLEIHKYEPEKLCQLLSSFVHAELLYATKTADKFVLDRLNKQINLYISRYDKFALKTNFDLATFKAITQARIDITLGNNQKGKKMLYKIISNLGPDIEKLPPTITSNAIMGLWQLGEYEYAEELSKNYMPLDNVDPILSGCINATCNDPSMEEKIAKYKEINKLGIQSYKNGDFEKSLEYFNEALRKFPNNTNAALNKAMVLLKLSKNSEQPNNTNNNSQENYAKSCKELITSIDGLQLGQAQIKRLQELKETLTELEQKK